ncbi:MAG TPA: cation diffusion facilitator family transporter [Thermoanaerobaculia bacterium]|nr:cation diffusion facilitator family transporter [Thermoanaerobaculia bacterium]
MAHGHAHHRHPHGAAARSASRRRLALTLVLVTLYMGAEVVGGLLTHSLALLADAGHMLSDAAALALSLFALWVVDRRRPGPLSTYGYYRAEILAALVNGAALVAIAILIAVEAVARLRAPAAVDAPGMTAVAAGGLVVNLVALALLHGSRGESLNLRGAWLHVASDALGSVQAIAAGVLIWAFGWQWADPLASLLIAVLVVWSAWGLLKEALAVLMEAAPGHIDVDAVRDAMLGVGCVAGVHDLHVWSIASGFECLSAHVVAGDGKERDALLDELRRTLHDRFGIDHITIQLEAAGFVEHHPDCEPVRAQAGTRRPT